eukprot:CAMPEP_0202770194 /NCGR_PEP_ID=MMETSP1388-20130828/38334_1 /ASSEMBLY_ACC=CAM_ASM_000864 /TAXON_ID=37098 /ORGANISM="Isochrysis sp, Strain CCMP1244" /LENGTH=172 /DNA_ID=CAMNT_0049439021 /DNA_START=10 /DNA_END=525 /DNA_ORIENTATION=+
MWPVYTAPPAGTSRDDAGHVGGLGGGRGALEALIARSAASASAGASAAAAEESPAAEATPANLEVEIAYTRQPSSAARCGARAGAGGFSLLESTFRKQHGAIPCDFDPSSLGCELVRLPCSVRDARALQPPPSLATHGFELVSPRPRLTSLPPDAADAEGAAPLQLHYAEVA